MSIITIVLNGELHIKETIESVICQEGPEIEYIIIDGGSKDNTLKIVENYKDKIDVIVSEPDNGIYNAINKGVKLAKGSLIGLIHCGDYYEPKALSLVNNEFIRSNADIIYGDINYLEQNLKREFKLRKNADHNLLDKRMSIYHPATFIKRECYLNYGLYNEKYKIAADYDLFLNYYKKKLLFQHIPVVLTNFRTDGISGSGTKELIKENFQIRLEHIGRVQALLYLVLTRTVHGLLIIRKSCLEIIIGKQNYSKLRFFLNKRWFDVKKGKIENG